MGTLHPFPGTPLKVQAHETSVDPAYIKSVVSAFAEALAAVERGDITSLVILWTGADSFGATPIKGEAFDVGGMIAATARLQKSLLEACDCE